MGKKHFCFFQTAGTGNRAPNSGVEGSGANHYPRAPTLPDMVFKPWACIFVQERGGQYPKRNRGHIQPFTSEGKCAKFRYIVGFLIGLDATCEISWAQDIYLFSQKNVECSSNPP